MFKKYGINIQNIILKQYTGDIQQYFNLQRTSHIPFRDEFEKNAIKSISLQQKNEKCLFLGVIYGLYENDNLLGACRLVNFYSDDKIIEVFDVVIDPKYQGKKLGSIMLKLLINELKTSYKDRKKLILSTGDACEFYQKNNFNLIGKLKNHSFMWIDL